MGLGKRLVQLANECSTLSGDGSVPYPQSIAIRPLTSVINPAAPRVAERTAPLLGAGEEAAGEGLEAVVLLFDAARVPFMAFASAANAVEERGEDSSELMDNTMPEPQ